MLLRRGAREPEGSAAELVQRVLLYEPKGLPRLLWLLAYGDVRQGGAVITAMRQVLLSQEHQPQQTASTTSAAAPNSADQPHCFVDKVALIAAALLETYAVTSPWLDTAGGSAAPGSPRLQLLLSYAVRQLLPPLVRAAQRVRGCPSLGGGKAGDGGIGGGSGGASSGSGRVAGSGPGPCDRDATYAFVQSACLQWIGALSLLSLGDGEGSEVEMHVAELGVGAAGLVAAHATGQQGCGRAGVGADQGMSGGSSRSSGSSGGSACAEAGVHDTGTGGGNAADGQERGQEAGGSGGSGGSGAIADAPTPATATAASSTSKCSSCVGNGGGADGSSGRPPVTVAAAPMAAAAWRTFLMQEVDWMQLVRAFVVSIRSGELSNPELASTAMCCLLAACLGDGGSTAACARPATRACAQQELGSSGGTSDEGGTPATSSNSSSSIGDGAGSRDSGSGPGPGPGSGSGFGGGAGTGAEAGCGAEAEAGAGAGSGSSFGWSLGTGPGGSWPGAGARAATGSVAGSAAAAGAGSRTTATGLTGSVAPATKLPTSLLHRGPTVTDGSIAGKMLAAFWARQQGDAGGGGGEGCEEEEAGETDMAATLRAVRRAVWGFGDVAALARRAMRGEGGKVVGPEELDRMVIGGREGTVAGGGGSGGAGDSDGGAVASGQSRARRWP